MAARLASARPRLRVSAGWSIGLENRSAFKLLTSKLRTLAAQTPSTPSAVGCHPGTVAIIPAVVHARRAFGLQFFLCCQGDGLSAPNRRTHPAKTLRRLPAAAFQFKPFRQRNASTRFDPRTLERSLRFRRIAAVLLRSRSRSGGLAALNSYERTQALLNLFAKRIIVSVIRDSRTAISRIAVRYIANGP